MAVTCGYYDHDVGDYCERPAVWANDYPGRDTVNRDYVCDVHVENARHNGPLYRWDWYQLLWREPLTPEQERALVTLLQELSLYARSI